MIKKVNSVEEYLENHTKFYEGLALFRKILIATELDESIKWNAPVYALKGKNVVGLAAYKNHFGLWFFNGVFLKDKYNVLVTNKGKTAKALRQLKFNSIEEVDENIVKSYILESIENQKLGKIFKTEKKKKLIEIPSVFKEKLQNKQLNEKFESLSLSCKNEYLEYISSAKKEETKLKRIDKIIPMILAKKGLNDKYKNC